MGEEAQRPSYFRRVVRLFVWSLPLAFILGRKLVGLTYLLPSCAGFGGAITCSVGLVYALDLAFALVAARLLTSRKAMSVAVVSLIAAAVLLVLL